MLISSLRISIETVETDFTKQLTSGHASSPFGRLHYTARGATGNIVDIPATLGRAERLAVDPDIETTQFDAAGGKLAATPDLHALHVLRGRIRHESIITVGKKSSRIFGYSSSDDSAKQSAPSKRSAPGAALPSINPISLGLVNRVIGNLKSTRTVTALIGH